MNAELYARARTVFVGAIEVPPENREAFVVRACRSDLLLESEVRALLVAHDEARGFDSLAAAGTGGHDEPGPPERIGEFRILRVLGRGGMGVVYEAEQATPHRVVALKVLRFPDASPARLRRFEREAEILGLLHHAGIAQVYAVGRADAGRGPEPYIAMELVEGKPLGEFAAERRLDARAKVALLEQVARAVEHAHAHGVVHRDLKPGNVLVTHEGTPKVLDFGIARAAELGGGADSLLTHEGDVLGTLPYMAPEQIGGDPAAIDLRADVYALGVVGYELLAGRLPILIEGERLPEAARRISEVVPPPLGAVDRALRGDLATIFAKALEKDRERRYATAGRFADDLGRYLRHEPIEARDPSTIYQLSRFARRNRVLVGGVCAVFLALVGGIVATTRQARRADAEAKAALFAKTDAEREQSRAEAAEHATRREASRVEQANRMTMNVFSMSQPDKLGRNVLLLDALREQAKSVSDSAGLDPEIEAIQLHSIGGSFAEAGLEKEAEPLLRRALERSRHALGPHDPFTVLVADDLAETLRFLGRAPEAVEILRATLADLERSPANGVVDLAPAYGKTRRLLGGSLLDCGQLDEAAAILGALYAEKVERGEPFDHATVTSASNLGAALLYKGRFDDAVIFLSDADEKFRAGGHATDSAALALRSNLSSAYRRVGLYEESEELAVEVLDAHERMSGLDHAEALNHAQGLARLYQLQGKHDAAAALDRRTLGLLEKKQGYTGPGTMICLVRFFATLDQLGHRAELEAGLTTMCSTLAELPMLELDEHLNALKYVADVDLRWKNLAEAVPIAEEIVSVGEKRLSPNHPNLFRYRETLASCRFFQRRFDESEDLLRTCREFYVGTQGPAGPDTRRIEANLARVASARVDGR